MPAIASRKSVRASLFAFWLVLRRPTLPTQSPFAAVMVRPASPPASALFARAIDLPLPSSTRCYAKSVNILNVARLALMSSAMEVSFGELKG